MSDYTFTDMAVGYSVDELDDLTSRKVAPEGVDGDRMARIVRARRGVARATGQQDPYEFTADDADDRAWGGRSAWPTADRRNATRRMAAVGGAMHGGRISVATSAYADGTGEFLYI